MASNKYFDRSCVEEKVPLTRKRKHRVWDRILYAMFDCLEGGFEEVEEDIETVAPIDPEFDCDVSVSVGDVVYVDAANHVALAFAGVGGNQGTHVVSAKPDPTRARVRDIGEVSGYSGLVPGEHYYLSMVFAGKVVTPANPVGPPGTFNQRIGVATDVDTLAVDPDDEPIYF